MAAQEFLTVTGLNRDELSRVFSKIEVDRLTGCWNWTAGLTSGPNGGYGKIKFRDRTELSHRLLYAWLVGPIPRGQSADIENLDHIHCDNRRCCFPGHMTLSTPKANTLRGGNPPAHNARKTHCKNGHPLPTSRTTWDGSRECPICKRAAHTSERFVNWNREFGRQNHLAHRYGPDREAFLKAKRDYMREYRRRKANEGTE